MITGKRLSAALLMAALLTGACTVPGAAPTNTPAVIQASSGLFTDRTAAGDAFGYAPLPDAPVTYQPDVIRVDGGPDAVRSVSGNGLTWTISAGAKGVDDLAVGKVMFMTSRGVGRVAALERSGDDILVTLTPVQLTEVFRDAHFVVDRDLTPGGARYQLVPDQPGMRESTEQIRAPVRASRSSRSPRNPRPAAAAAAAQPVALTVPALRFAAAGRRPLPPPVEGISPAASINNWTFKPYQTGSKSGLIVIYNDPSGLKASIDIALGMSQIHLRADVHIIGGAMSGSSTFALDGLDSISIDLAAGAAQGLQDNTKIKIDIPIEEDTTFLVGGVPMDVATTWKFSFATAFTSKNSTLKAGGLYSLKGPIGIVSGVPVLPELTVTSSLVDSIRGISLTPAGVTLASELKVQLGVGIPKFLAGPYLKFVLSVGLTNGSALGAPLARCTGAALVGKAGGGVGVTMSTEATAALKAFLGLPFKLGVAVEKERLATFIDRTSVVPDVPLCRA